MNPPQYKINTVATSNDAFGRPRESYGICAYNEQGWFFLALAILNGGILVLSMLQSWHARGLATEFAESKYVFLALASTTVVVFVGAPVLVLARDTPNAVLFLGSSINFVCKCIGVCRSINLQLVKYNYHLTTLLCRLIGNVQFA
jgi:hypothetical protein